MQYHLRCRQIIGKTVDSDEFMDSIYNETLEFLFQSTAVLFNRGPAEP